MSDHDLPAKKSETATLILCVRVPVDAPVGRIKSQLIVAAHRALEHFTHEMPIRDGTRNLDERVPSPEPLPVGACATVQFYVRPSDDDAFPF